MRFRNKFSVAAADLNGTWSQNDVGTLQYYYVNTGGYAGSTATASSNVFTFLPGGRYESDHAGASGVVGNLKFNRVVYKGSATVSDWTIVLTNRFQGATDTFQCSFEAVRGGRILHLAGANGMRYSLGRKRD
jgi:hypothetical protein